MFLPLFNVNMTTAHLWIMAQSYYPGFPRFALVSCMFLHKLYDFFFSKPVAISN